MTTTINAEINALRNRWVSALVVITYAVFAGLSFEFFHQSTLDLFASQGYPRQWVFLIDLAYIACTVMLIFLLLAWLLQMIRKYEERIEASECRYRRLVETTPDLVWVTNDRFQYTFVSPVAHDLLGYAPADLLGRTPCDLMSEDDAEEMRGKLSACASTAPALRCITVRYRHRDGRVIPVETSFIPIRDSAGTLQGYQGIDRDITERQKSESALVRTTEFYRELFDEFPLPLWRSGRDGAITYYNAAAIDYLGHTPSEMADLWSDIHPDDHARFTVEFEQAVEARLPFSITYRLQRADGSCHWIRHVGKPIFEQHNVFLGHAGYFLSIGSTRPMARMDARKNWDISSLAVH